MRLNQSIQIAAPAQVIWDYITEPDNCLHYMSGLTRWEVEGDQRTGLGARYRMLMRVGSAEVGGLIEIVEWDETCDFAWNSITGIDQRARWRLRNAGRGRTRVEFRFAYGIAGSGPAGWISELVAAPTMGKNIRDSLNHLKRQIEHEQLRRRAEERRRARQTAAA